MNSRRSFLGSLLGAVLVAATKFYPASAVDRDAIPVKPDWAATLFPANPKAFDDLQRLEVLDETGSSMGFVAIYSSIC